MTRKSRVEMDGIKRKSRTCINKLLFPFSGLQCAHSLRLASFQMRRGIITGKCSIMPISICLEGHEFISVYCYVSPLKNKVDYNYYIIIWARTEESLGRGDETLAKKNNISYLYTYPVCALNIWARVVRKVDNAFHRINRYPADSVVCFVNTYPLISDLSGGYHLYPAFQQLGPDAYVIWSPPHYETFLDFF